MTVETLIARYGLAALFVGAGLEGEAVVIAGGVLARKGLFPLAGAMAAAAAGSFIADQLWFFLGRRFRGHRWVRRAQAKPAFAKALALFERHPTGFIFAFRFIYGFRTVSPIAIGTTAVSPRLFVAVNLVSAITWGITFAAVGYLFGHALERLVARFIPDTNTLIGVAGAAAMLVGAVLLIRGRRAA